MLPGRFEWLFGDITNYFETLNFTKNLKGGLSSVGKMYIVSSLLQNALICLYGNQTSSLFFLEPPTLGVLFFDDTNGHKFFQCSINIKGIEKNELLKYVALIKNWCNQHSDTAC